jgi:transcriptional regulator with XRE-family HTH domain
MGGLRGEIVATSHMAVRKPIPIGMADGVTNTHVRKQIKKLRLAKGWTQHDLAEAAGMADSSLGCLETGFYRLNLDSLRKLIDALEADITEVWPSTKRISRVKSDLSLPHASDPTNFFRLAEVHSLTGAEASCMFTSSGQPGPASKAAEEKSKPALRALYTINLEENERWQLSRQLIEGTVTAPWAAYFHRDNGRSLFLCLKNACVEIWVEDLIEWCLSAWLASLPL